MESNKDPEILKHEKNHNLPFKRTSPFPQRNSLCRCGSGKKFKKCCELIYKAKLKEHVRKQRYLAAESGKQEHEN